MFIKNKRPIKKKKKKDKTDSSQMNLSCKCNICIREWSVKGVLASDIALVTLLLFLAKEKSMKI